MNAFHKREVSCFSMPHSPNAFWHAQPVANLARRTTSQLANHTIAFSHVPIRVMRVYVECTRLRL